MCWKLSTYYTVMCQKKEDQSLGEEISVGYTKEEYYKISLKLGLPKRCPILSKCRRSVLTRYMMGHVLGGNNIPFDNFIENTSQKWEPENMIEEIEQISISNEQGIFCSVENSCPEVSLFEGEYVPFCFKQSAFGEAYYNKELKIKEVTPKHFTECAEFSQYIFDKNIKLKKPSTKRKRSPISKTLRFEIFQRDKFTCHYCKKHKDELEKGIHLTLDHKVPYCDGGEDSYENLVTACSVCNIGKSNKIVNNI